MRTTRNSSRGRRLEDNIGDNNDNNNEYDSQHHDASEEAALAQEQQQQEQQDEVSMVVDEFAMVSRRAAAPDPPPPPPSLRRRAFNNNNTTTANAASTSSQVQQPTVGTTADATATDATSTWWTLTVVTSTTTPPIHIAIDDQMTPTILSQCIAQAMMSTTSDGTGNHRNSNQHDDGTDLALPIVGLFCDATNVFMSLQHILDHPPAQPAPRRGAVYRLHHHYHHRPLLSAKEQRQARRNAFWQQYARLVLVTSSTLVAAAAAILVHRLRTNTSAQSFWQFSSGSMIQMFHHLLSTLLQTLITQPLLEFYRFAPTYMGGWEGQELASICAQITFHGNADFWAMNLDECQRIFHYKQLGFLSKVQPLVYLLLAGAVVWWIGIVVRLVVQHILIPYFIRRPTRREREMADTYHALQVLIRQFQRQEHREQQHQQHYGYHHEQ